MSRPRNSIPTPRCHKGSAVIDVYDGDKRRTVTLGPWNSPQAESAFSRYLAERDIAGTGKRIGMIVNEVLLKFIRFAAGHYVRPDGTNTHELDEYKLVCRYVRELYGYTPAKDFGPVALKTIRQKFIAVGWCRNIVNQRTNRVRRIFKWAAAEELVPITVHTALDTVSGLQRGRSGVRETAPVEPVDDEAVDTTLPFLTRHVRGLVEFQRLTGCRPGEACSLRRADIDTGGAIWLYRPEHHKGTWRGKPRVIAIGPKAQALLREFFTTKIDDFLFSPRRAVDEHHAERGVKRMTPRFQSHMKRNSEKRKKAPERIPAERYDVTSYGHAIKRACDKAFPPPAPLAMEPAETVAQWWARLTEEQRAEVKAWQKAHLWAPNQLRHSHGTKVRKQFGLEAAGAALGHTKMSATEIYAERDAGLAVEVAAKIG